MNDKDEVRAVSAHELMAMSFPEPPWNGWELDGEYLIYKEWGYPVDLLQMRNPGEMLDIIFQVATTKTWATSECVQGLLNALTVLLNPQETLCSSGQIKRLRVEDISKRIRTYKEKHGS